MWGETVELNKIDRFETPNEIIHLGKDHQRVREVTGKFFKCRIRL